MGIKRCGRIAKFVIKMLHHGRQSAGKECGDVGDQRDGDLFAPRDCGMLKFLKSFFAQSPADPRVVPYDRPMARTDAL